MKNIHRFFRPSQSSYFLFGPRGTGKSTFLKQYYKDAEWINLLDPEAFRVYSNLVQVLSSLLKWKMLHDFALRIFVDCAHFLQCTPCLYIESCYIAAVNVYSLTMFTVSPSNSSWKNLTRQKALWRLCKVLDWSLVPCVMQSEGLINS